MVLRQLRGGSDKKTSFSQKKGHEKDSMKAPNLRAILMLQSLYPEIRAMTVSSTIAGDHLHNVKVVKCFKL